MRTLDGLSTLFAALVLLTGCGGGGSNTRGDISISPTSVTVNTTEGDAPSATIVHVNFEGDGVVVGYAPGVAQPSWLSVAQQGSATQTSADFALNFPDTTTVGTRSTSVRFVTGRLDGSDVRTVDLPVTYTITASDLALSTSSSSVTFSGAVGSTAVASQTVNVTYNGAAVTLTGVPSWLTVTPATAGTGQETYTFAANGTGYGPGTTLTADVFFSTSRPGHALTRSNVVHVTYNILQPFDATANAATLAFASVAKSTQPAQPSGGYTLSIIGAQPRWRVTSNASWLTFSPASGTGAGTVLVTANTSAQAHGNYSDTITVTDDDSGTSRTFPVTLTNRAPRMVVAPSNAAYNVDVTTTLAELSKSLQVTDELGGTVPSEAVTWSTQSIDQPWLQWTPGGGTTSPAASSTLSLNKTELAKLAPGAYTATVTLKYTSADGSGGTLPIPVTLNYNLAQVTFVGPYIGVAGRNGWLYVRGSKFTASNGTLTVSIGSTDIPNLIPDSDSQVRVSYPALAAGRYTVNIKNQIGIGQSTAEFVVLDPASVAYQGINASSVRQRLVYDAERATLYGVNLPDQEIEVYHLANGTWTTDAPYVVPNLTDIALTPNGRSLIVLTSQGIDELALPVGTSVIQPRVATGNSSCGNFPEALAMGNDGRAFVVTDLSGGCSGFTPSYLYDITAHTFIANPYAIGWLYDGVVAGAANGSKIFAGTRNVSPAQPVKTYNSLNDTITDNTNVSYNLTDVTVSGDASVVILEGVDVYSGSMTLLGHLPPNGKVLASRDSSKAYVYRDDGAAPRLDIYDVHGPLGAGALYPLLKTVNLTDSPNSTSQHYFSISMAETPDGNTVFVSGDSKIVVQPVN